MTQNNKISLSLANKIDILNKTQSVDARYGVYDTRSDALLSMQSYGADGRQVAVYTDKPNGKVELLIYNEVLDQLDPISASSDITKEEIEAKLTGNITSHSHTVTKANVGLGNVDNTSDANKPISTATQTALNGKLGTGAQAYDSARLGGYLANLYPRRNVDEVITGKWIFRNEIRLGKAGGGDETYPVNAFIQTAGNGGSGEGYSGIEFNSGRWSHTGIIALYTTEGAESIRFNGLVVDYLGRVAINKSTGAIDKDSLPTESLDVSGNGLFSGNVTAQKGTLSSLDVSGIINMGGNKVATESWVLEKFSEHPITIEGGIIDGGDSSD